MTEPCQTIIEILEAATQRLTTSDSPRLDAELLLAYSLQQPRSHLHAWPERAVGPDRMNRFASFLERRCAGEPMAHILGVREFWSLSLKVTADTLIPRPETEALVEQALTRIPVEQDVQVADLGTGSGAIALAIADERPRAQVTATDLSQNALSIAHENIEEHGLRNVSLLHGDWCTVLDREQFDVIVSNPPYIAAQDPHLSQGDVRFDPHSALVSGADGLDDLRRIVTEARSCLRPGGWLLVEHGYDQGPAVQALLDAADYAAVASHPDLSGHVRLTEGRRPPE